VKIALVNFFPVSNNGGATHTTCLEGTRKFELETHFWFLKKGTCFAFGLDER
jgi:hypothetical protein